MLSFSFTLILIYQSWLGYFMNIQNVEKEILGRILHLVCSIYTYGVPFLTFVLHGNN